MQNSTTALHSCIIKSHKISSSSDLEIQLFWRRWQTVLPICTILAIKLYEKMTKSWRIRKEPQGFEKFLFYRLLSLAKFLDNSKSYRERNERKLREKSVTVFRFKFFKICFVVLIKKIPLLIKRIIYKKLFRYLVLLFCKFLLDFFSLSCSKKACMQINMPQVAGFKNCLSQAKPAADQSLVV